MRPFRNPETQAQVDANQRWKIEQYRVPPDNRQEFWQNTAAWQIDRIDLAPDCVDYPHPLDPWELGGAPPRVRARREPNRDILRNYKKLDLAKLTEGPAIERDLKLPPFKVDYDTHEQINQKLNASIILIRNNPFFVSQTAEVEAGQFALVVNDVHGNNFSVMYSDVADCRGIAPAYYMYRGQACWFYRVPERQNSQGMNQRNMHYRPCDGRSNIARTDVLLSALSQAKDIPYAPNLGDLLLGGANTSLRLSSKVALYLSGKKGAPIGVEYCGRPLGLVVNDACKVTDETDLMPSWLHKDLGRIGLPLVA